MNLQLIYLQCEDDDDFSLYAAIPDGMTKEEGIAKAKAAVDRAREHEDSEDMWPNLEEIETQLEAEGLVLPKWAGKVFLDDKPKEPEVYGD